MDADTFMRYLEIINRMERNGDYSAAMDYKESLRESGISEHQNVDRHNPADGAQHTYSGDRAEEAYRDILASERRAEERREEQKKEAAEQEYLERNHYEQMHQQDQQEQ